MRILPILLVIGGALSCPSPVSLQPDGGMQLSDGGNPPAPDASCAEPDAGIDGGQRLFFNSVNAGSAQLIFQSDFQGYVDAMVDAGLGGLHVFGQWRQRCYQCAGGTPIDMNTEPTLGVYDFSQYFQRLDYAITGRGMIVVLSFNFSGRLDTDPPSTGAYNALPAFLDAGEVMTYRDASGADVVYAGTPPVSGMTKIPRFENPLVRAALLDFVTAVVTQFRARYGQAILYYAFTFNPTGENEYVVTEGLQPGSFVDTSSDATSAFQQWLASRYSTPADVSTSWGTSPPFTSFNEIRMLNGQPPPPTGQAPAAYLDVMAYREAALGAFLREVRDRVHAAGGRVMAQFGSVWDSSSAQRGTFGFGRQIPGFDLVVIDDSPDYDHLFSMDYTRTNSPGVPFGIELDAPCRFGCSSGNEASCCDASTFPANIDVNYGTTRMDAQLSDGYQRGATYVDLANWDNFYTSAFTLFAPALDAGELLSYGESSAVSACPAQSLSLRGLYAQHENQNYINLILQAHNQLGGPSIPVAVIVNYDL
jgi:hypothetical protein